MTKRKKLSFDAKSLKKCLIDGDILLYRIGFAYEDQGVDIAKQACSEYIDHIIKSAGCLDYEVFLTDSKGNFRNTVYPLYKANRVQPKPTHYADLKQHLIERHWATVAVGQEADDLLGINQTEDTVIATIDKDLDQVEGWHYNFVKDKNYFVTKEQGLHKFWQQMLTGDVVDNIPGIKGIGPRKADKLLEGCVTEREYAERVYQAYVALKWEIDIPSYLNILGKLLYIRRKDGEMWSKYSEG